MRIAEPVEKLVAYVPGEQPKSKDVVKLNTNENPYPPSPECAKVLSGFDIDRLRRYPDPVFTQLRETVSRAWGVPAKSVFVGNGSDEILSLAAKAFVEDDERIGSLDPSYSLYKTLAAIRNVEFAPTALDADFRWNGKADGNPALFLLTNPNAPTGVCAKIDTIREFAATFPGVCLVDEAYADFSGQTAIGLAAGSSNIIVMRTLSKSYSLAGLRLGICIGPEDLIDALYKVKDSYNVDAVAQAVACAAIEDRAWMEKNTAKIKATRSRLTDALRAMGCDVPESGSNFVFARPARRAAAEIFDGLRRENIYVRYFPGERTGDRLRITVGTDEETDRLLAALARLDK